MTRKFGLDHIPRRPNITSDFGLRREQWVCRALYIFAGIATGAAVLAIAKWWPLACL